MVASCLLIECSCFDMSLDIVGYVKISKSFRFCFSGILKRNDDFPRPNMLHVSRSVRNHYQQLGVGFRASQDEIKAAFRELAKKYHPDQNPENKDAEKKFMTIKKSYDFLSNKVKRAEYDRELIKSGEARWIYARKDDEGSPDSSSDPESNDNLTRNQLIGLYGVMIGLPFLVSLMRRPSPTQNSTPAPQKSPSEFWTQSPPLIDISPRDELVRAFFNPMSQRWERLDEGVDPPSPYVLFQHMIKTRRGAYMREFTSTPIPPRTGIELQVSEVPARIISNESIDYNTDSQVQ